MYKIGNVVKFDYLGKARWVRIEKIKLGYSIFLPSPNPLVITGWDYEADHPVGGGIVASRCRKSKTPNW
jgi:hypothetical protein